MIITLSRRAAICQSVAEVKLTGIAPLEAVSHRFDLIIIIIIIIIIITIKLNLWLTAPKGATPVN